MGALQRVGSLQRDGLTAMSTMLEEAETTELDAAYLVIPDAVWLGQKAEPEVDEDHDDGRIDADDQETYYLDHQYRPMTRAAVLTAGGLTTSLIAGLLPGLFVAAPGGMVAGVAAGVFGGLMGRQLAEAAYDRRHGG